MTIKTHIEADSFALTNDNYVIQICNIIHKEDTNNTILSCKIFKEKTDLFIKPLKSSILNIYVVKHLSKNYLEYDVNTIKKKKL